MQQVFADKSVAVARALEFAAQTACDHYVIKLARGWAVCDDAGLEPHRPASYQIFRANSYSSATR